MAIAQISTATPDSKWKFFLNYQGGHNSDTTTLNQFDLVLTGTITDKFSVGFNATDQMVKYINTNSWWGAALYLNIDPSPKFGATLRAEYFDNKDAVSAAPATSLFNLTLSPNFKIGNLTIIPELRFESAKDEIFFDKDGAGTKSTFTGLLAATYHF